MLVERKDFRSIESWRSMMPLSRTLLRSIDFTFLSLLILTAGLLGEHSIASAGDEPISIGSIIINPQANHRRSFVFKGTVKNVRIQDGSDQFGQKTCGQVFDLEDNTGSIDVWYIVKCQTGDTVVTVAEDEQIIVHATIDAPPTNVMTPHGKDLGVRAMATKLVKGRP